MITGIIFLLPDRHIKLDGIMKGSITGIGILNFRLPGYASFEDSSLKLAVHSRKTRISILFLLFMFLITFLAPLLAPYSYTEMDLARILSAPSPEHILGTDELGRDMLSRLLYGGRYSLLVASLALAIALIIGVSLGALAGYAGEFVDRIVTSIIDLFLSIPVFMVLLVLSVMCSGSLWGVAVVIGALSWMEPARIVRAQVKMIRQREFVEAARTVGVDGGRLLFRHILPISIQPLTVTAAAIFAQAMLAESALSFLGFGVQPPIPTWGNMLRNAQLFINSTPLLALIPGFLIFLVCLAVNVIGEEISERLAE